MAQTPTQRKANERYARAEAHKRGKPESVIKPRQTMRPSISTPWILLLGFVVCGGVVFELLRFFL